MPESLSGPRVQTVDNVLCISYRGLCFTRVYPTAEEAQAAYEALRVRLALAWMPVIEQAMADALYEQEED